MPVRTFQANGRSYGFPRGRVLAVCLDGVDPEYLVDAFGRGLMPNLEDALSSSGLLSVARAQMPTLTNVNNASIVTGATASVHGISGNHYLAEDGSERQLDQAGDLRADTILAVAASAGISVLCVTAKRKLRGFLASGGVPTVSAEGADSETVHGLEGSTAADALGVPAPDVYNPELSCYAMDLALRLGELLGSQLVYCSLTDYVQHMAPPGDALADAYLTSVDARLGQAISSGWMVGLTADHGMNDKAGSDGRPRVRYLLDLLEAGGVKAAQVVLPITDPYVVHHGALGSIAWVYVSADDRALARGILAGQQGIEAVLDRRAAAQAFELPPDRIGDLMVCADAHTVVGKSAEYHDLGQRAAPLRSHGGLHEQFVPIAICGATTVQEWQLRQLRNFDLFDLLLNGSADG